MKVEPILEVYCTCGGHVTVGTVLDKPCPEVEAGTPSVFHTFPVCALFVEKKPDEFLRALREHYEAKAPS